MVLQQQKPIVKSQASSLNGKPSLPETVTVEGKKPQRQHWPLLQWFLDLPLGQKQLVALLGSEVLTLTAIVFGGQYIIRSSLRQELANKAASENAVTAINYNIKINQMGFGFRGQADNTAIVSAARLYSRRQPVPTDLRAQVRNILRKEIEARTIEYATLVGADKRIIVNANANRTGEVFDPEGLVSAILKDSRQIKASAIVSWAELQKETPPLPDGFVRQDALMRYTVTAVRDPGSGQVIGALVSGDIVNAKAPIVRNTLKAFGSGYSAVYARDRDGNFKLATSLQKTSPDAPLDSAAPGISLPQDTLLSQAIAANGKPVTTRLAIGGQTYTLAAQTEPSLLREEKSGPVAVAGGLPPVAILVRGTSEAAQENLLRFVLLEAGVVFLVALAVITLWSLLLRRTITKRIENLREATRTFAEGDRAMRTEDTARDEIGQLAVTFNEMATSIATFEAALQADARRNQLLAQISNATNEREMLGALTQLLENIQVRLGCDRVVVYRFKSDWSGYILAEAAPPIWKKTLEFQVNDPCIPAALLEEYRQGRVVPTTDVYNAGFHPEHLELMYRLDIKSNLVVPIVSGAELFGLLVAHHCAQQHEWQASEIDELKRESLLLAPALGSLLFIEQQQLIAEQERQRSEALQRELIALLSDVEGAAQGDLTVRAQITAGEIGIVADFFNAIVESLRDVVTQVKQATAQVSASVTANDAAIRELAAEAAAQNQQLGVVLQSVEEMAGSIQQVARSAKQAAEASTVAANTAETGSAAIEESVESIQQLRQTVAETAKKVKHLGEASQEISKVVALIDRIALKTNMLAVNASIEAAKAGEEGRGFAVVAEEVGVLAAQSATATKEIERIVESIQQETSEVVDAMEASTMQVVEGTRKVEAARQNLGEIVEVARRVNQLFQGISHATVSQARTSQNVKSLMEELAALSQRSSQTSQEVSATLQETVSVARQLQASVATFKVETA